jgi:hypothetical protein
MRMPGTSGPAGQPAGQSARRPASQPTRDLTPLVDLLQGRALTGPDTYEEMASRGPAHYPADARKGS